MIACCHHQRYFYTNIIQVMISCPVILNVTKMKKLIILFLIFCTIKPAKAQIIKSVTAYRQVGSAQIKIAKPELKLAPGKDLTIVIDTVIDRSTATKSDVDVYYSIINSGLADIDIKNISIQLLINGTYATASATAAPVFTNSSSVLHSGQKWNDRNYNSGLGFKVTVMRLSDVTQPLFVNQAYNISLLADADNNIAETYENNNSASASVTGHYVPSIVDLAIGSLTVKYNAANKNYDVSCRIGNVGTTAVDINQLKYWDCVNKGSYMGYANPIVLGYVMQANCGQSGCGFSIRLDIQSPSNIINPGQVITATGFAHGFHGACGGPLNFTYILDPDNKTGDQNLNNNTVVLSVNH